MECQVVPSKGEARRAIEAGGIYLNNRRVAESAFKISRLMSSTANFWCCVEAARITGSSASPVSLSSRRAYRNLRVPAFPCRNLFIWVMHFRSFGSILYSIDLLH